ncbi:MAG: ABC transporter permease [Chlamydia sp.]
MKKGYTSFSEWLLSFPSMAWLILFFLLPTAIVTKYCFQEADIADGSILPGYSFNSLTAIFLENETYIALIRTIWLSLISTAICVAISLPISYYLAILPKKRQHKLLLLILLPFWSSFLVRIFAWKALLHPEGFLKNMLLLFGLVDESTSLLYNNTAVIAVMVYSYIPFAILPLYNSASKFDFFLIEAALDLGATRSKAFFSIFIPSMRNAIVTASIMVLIPVAGAYVIPDVVGGVDSEMLGNKISTSIFIDRNFPEASSYSLLLGITLTLLTALLMRCNGPISSYQKRRNNEA